jgi:predicted nucleic acid-binding protein
VIDTKDKFHKEAIALVKTILNNPNILPKIWIILPSIVLLETTAVLLRRGIPSEDVEAEIWKFLHLTYVLPVSVPETLFIKFLNLPSPFWKLKTADLTLTALAVEYDAQILTFDEKLKKNIYPSYSYIYNCANKNEQNLFVKDLAQRIWR